LFFLKAINLFTNIWGAGATTARGWVAQGFRTLDDLRNKAHLTRHQKIGLQYYEELLDRMPRCEAAEIEKVVSVCFLCTSNIFMTAVYCLLQVVDAVKAIDDQLIAMACGSYRRGKQTCGDVDVLITHPDGKSHKGVFATLLAALHKTGRQAIQRKKCIKLQQQIDILFA
jgi:DNA polymerase lambda